MGGADGHSKDQAKAAKKYAPDAPVDESNEMAQQKVMMYSGTNCKGSTATFTSSGNAFFADFAPFVHNLASVKLCGKGTFFYFASPDMSYLATLGHVTRCGEEIDKDMSGCTC